MSQLENPNQRTQQDSDKAPLDGSSLLADNGAMSSISKMETAFTGGVSVPDFELVSFAQSGAENMHQRVSNTLVKVLDGVNEGNKLASRTPEANTLKTGIKIIFETEGAKAADKLADEISPKLQDGLKLKISEVDAKTRAAMEDQARKTGAAIPEYMRRVELIDKEGKSLGSFDLGLAPASKELVAQLTKSKHLDGQSLNMIADELSRRLTNGGAKEADAFAKEISDKLPEKMQLKIVEDPEFAERVKAVKQKQGLPVPDYIRRIELLDKDGQLIGDHQHFMLTTPARQRNKPPRSA